MSRGLVSGGRSPHRFGVDYSDFIARSLTVLEVPAELQGPLLDHAKGRTSYLAQQKHWQEDMLMALEGPSARDVARGFIALLIETLPPHGQLRIHTAKFLEET